MFYGVELRSRLLLGTARYPSPAILERAIKASGAEVVTVSLRREGGSGRAGQSFWSFIQSFGLGVLPNTAGCHSVKEAVTPAHMARELFDTKWIKLEVIGDDDTLQPDVFGLVEAARVLSEDGFEVFPYTTEDLAVADRLVEAGCRVLMPWGAPIRSAPGPNKLYWPPALPTQFPDVAPVVDSELRRQVREAKAVCDRHGAQLIVNDYWKIAIDEKCPWVHLGQEDLVEADTAAIRRAGLRLGVSTHDHSELDKGLATDPDYVALGPIYPTLLKKMAFGPQGLDRIREWKNLIRNRPLVAIGGLTLGRALLCLQA